MALLLSLFAASALAGDVYVFKRGESSIIAGSVEELTPIFEQKGDFIWYRLDGRTYMIRDRNVLAEAARAFAPVEAMEPEYEALRARLRVVEQREEELDRKLDRGDDAAAEAEMREVRRQMRPLEEEERRLDRKQEALEKVAEKELREIVKRWARRR